MQQVAAFGGADTDGLFQRGIGQAVGGAAQLPAAAEFFQTACLRRGTALRLPVGRQEIQAACGGVDGFAAETSIPRRPARGSSKIRSKSCRA
ncbi:hypothetical protein NEIELOOT_00778, partial [Neisseria elongata subsp. glycolytica ATCC 29315]